MRIMIAFQHKIAPKIPVFAVLSKCAYATFTHQEIILIKNLRCDVTKLPRYSAATAHERTIKIRFTSDYVTQVRAVARMREQSSFSTLR